jgi:ribonuclease P protein component
MRLGHKATTTHLVVYLNHDANQTQPRFGFVVSKLVGNAVQRNLVKRRARAALHNRMSDFRPGDNLVLRALPGLAELSFEAINLELDQAMASLAKKAGV